MSHTTKDAPRIDPYASTAKDHQIQEEIDILRNHVTERRWERMITVLDRRTRYLAAVVEDVYQPHNGSAVLRSCDAFGIQDVHIVENRNRYQVNPGVELGTAQWLSLYRYTRPTRPDDGDPTVGTRAAVATLHRLGYRVYATSPHRDDVTPEDLNLETSPVALMFGAEKEGLSATALELADGYLRIPMHGFVESLNISVSAAITLQTLSVRLRNSDLPWRLDPEYRTRILARWLRRSVRHAPAILDRARARERSDEA